MEGGEYACKSKEEIAKLFGVNPETGWGEDEAEEKLKREGKNKILAKDTGAGEILWRQLRSPFVYLLVAAAILAAVLGEYSNLMMILVFVGINTSLGFLQEYKSEQTMRLLKRYLGARARVIRDGKEMEIDCQEVVDGEMVILKPGDIASADIRLYQTNNLACNESVLSGESMAVTKIDGRISKNKRVMLPENMIFAGTTIVSGWGTGIVVNAGKKTMLSKISKLSRETDSQGVFEKEIAKFSKFILKLVVVTIVLVFVANILIKGDRARVAELVLFSVALAVSVIPEALPLVTTFSFSQGARMLAKKKVVLKRLSAIEDLGGIEVLCTDKTGTLTENKMVVADSLQLGKDKIMVMAGAWIDKNIKNPIDIAIAKKLGKKKKNNVMLGNIPFDPGKLRDSVLVKKRSGLTLLTRGAPEAVLKVCDDNLTIKRMALVWHKQQGELGRRVLAVASKSLNEQPTDLEMVDNDYKLVGLISLMDPVKKSSLVAIKRAKNLGIEIKILTGDAIEVAEAVAKQVELIENNKEAMLGSDFEKLSAEGQMKAVMEKKVFARVSPEQKYKIIQLLMEKHYVGYLGDGINDAPALKLANVALAVKGATDVARESADIILLKKDLRVIVEGIMEGRKIFANTKKYIVTTLAANFGNFYAVAAASLLVDYLPMMPNQLLLVNLLSDFPMIAIATDNVDKTELRRPQKHDLRSVIYLSTTLGIVSSVFDFITFAVFSRLGAAVLQSAWFMESIITELVFIFSIRTKKFMFKTIRPSRALILLALGAVVVTVMLPLSQLGQKWFGFGVILPRQILIVGLIVACYLITTELIKKMYFKLVMA